MGWWNHLARKTKAEKIAAREELWSKKEKIYVSKEGSFPCPDDSHPLFTVKVTKEKLGVCYYCSKVFIYKDSDDGS